MPVDDREVKQYRITFERTDTSPGVAVQSFNVAGATPCLAQSDGFQQLEAWKRAEGLEASEWRLRSMIRR